MNKKYAFIPEFVLHNQKLTPTAKVVYGELTTLCDRQGLARVTYRDLALSFGYGIRTVSKALHLLRKEGYIKSVENIRGHQLILSKSELIYICENREEKQYAESI